MGKPSIMICRRCGSADIGMVALVVWSVADQTWSVLDTYDSPDCEVCEAPAEATMITLPHCTSLEVGPIVIGDWTRWQIRSKYRRVYEQIAHFSEQSEAISIAAALSEQCGRPVRFLTEALETAA